MRATVLSEINIPGLPSASGVEIVGRTAYVIGDDSPYLSLLDAVTLASTGRVPLFDATGFAYGRIPKPEKPDLECLVALTWSDGRPGLLLLGSGSLPTRARGWFVPTEGPQVPEAVDLTALYDALRIQLPAGVVLNLEAAATTATELLLFQRTVGRADAAGVFVLPLAATLALLSGRAGVVPPVAVGWFALPQIAGCPAGFSGATFVDGCLFVSASVEIPPMPCSTAPCWARLWGCWTCRPAPPNLPAWPGPMAALTWARWKAWPCGNTWHPGASSCCW